MTNYSQAANPGSPCFHAEADRYELAAFAIDGGVEFVMYRSNAASSRYRITLSEAEVSDLQLALAAHLYRPAGVNHL